MTKIKNIYMVVPGKNKRGLCAVKYCRKPKARRRTICHSCKHERTKRNDPIAYNYSYLKNNAKRRGKIFTISLEYFRDLCLRTGYHEAKGKKWFNMSIDRIDSSRGYEPGNLQIITVSENSRKGNKDIEPLPF